MKTFVAVAVFLTMAGQVCSAQSQPQSLADVARQNKQNRKAAVVVTEDNIAASEGVVSVVGDESVRVSGPTTASPQKTAAKGNAASADSNLRVAELKKKLDSYKAEQQTWKDSAKRYEGLLANTTDDFRRASYQEMLDNDKKSAAGLQQKIDQTSADLSKAQQEAAAAGSKSGPDSMPKAGPQP